MRNDGGSANPASTNDNEESKSQKFTAVNNNGNGNSTVTVSHRAQLPPLVSVQSTRDNGSNASPSTNNSPRVAEEQWQQGNRPGSDVEMSGTSQKRKRSPEVQSQPRAVTPTTQVAQRHLAAHGGGVMAEENSGDAQHNNQHRHQSSLGPEDQAGNYSVDEDMKGNEEGRARGGTQEGSPQPGTAQPGGGKRKRIFSNRTKTGCITCRRRKKKCDEGKPECLFSIPTFDYQFRRVDISISVPCPCPTT